MIKQNDIADFFGVSQSFISRVSNGEREVSWGMAGCMADMFPEKDIRAWKKTPFEKIISFLAKKTINQKPNCKVL